MFRCPKCSQRCSTGAERCPGCNANVRLLARLEELPDAWFNSALAAMRRGDAAKAQSLLNAVVSVRPADPEAWLLLGQAACQRRQWDAAAECWLLVRQFCPNDARPTKALAHLAVLRESPVTTDMSPATPESTEG
ncbi:MAG: tetratricopeptide repeat protein [Planctomycetaceae bacterium]|nr:tetratricopeptide repeat protein [Planctomycetaceae bacterium]